MSFEGYYQALCTNGHDCSADFSHHGACRQCGEPIVWSRLVDQTNGMDESDPSTMPIPLKVKTYRTIQIADTYEIPDPDLPPAA